MEGNVRATSIVNNQLVMPATLIAVDLGPCLNNSAPINHGMGPRNIYYNDNKIFILVRGILRLQLYSYESQSLCQT